MARFGFLKINDISPPVYLSLGGGRAGCCKELWSISLRSIGSKRRSENWAEGPLKSNYKLCKSALNQLQSNSHLLASAVNGNKTN